MILLFGVLLLILLSFSKINMDKFEQIKSLLLKINSNENQVDNIVLVDNIVKSENKNYNSYSKLIYDVFLYILKDYKNSNYSYSAYKSWFIHYENLELYWDGRDEYLLLWDISDGNKKTLKVIEADKINYKIINEFTDLISMHKQINF